MADANSRRRLGRPPLRMVVLAAVVALAVAGWSAFWLVAIGRAEAAFDGWLAAEAAQGRAHQCGERRTGGFPFRFELACAAPNVVLDAETGLVATGEALRAVLQVWQPDHLILEVDGPVRLAADQAPASPPAVIADWSLLQASLRLRDGRVVAVDVAAEELSVGQEGEPAALGGAVSVRASHAELHQRTREPEVPHRGIDLAASARDLVVTYPGADGATPVDVSVQGTAVGLDEALLDDPRGPLQAWQDGGGALTISSFVAAQAETRLVAEGQLAPEAGRLGGRLSLALAGPDVTTPGVAGAFGGLAPILAAALRFTGETTELDGQPALKGEISLREGVAYLGDFPVAEIPPLF